VLLGEGVRDLVQVPPSGGSLEIGNLQFMERWVVLHEGVPPSGGSLEIGNLPGEVTKGLPIRVPPSGGSLEIGNLYRNKKTCADQSTFPLRGDP